MSAPDINKLRDDLLVELAKRNASNGHPVSVSEICRDLYPDVDWSAQSELARSSGWLLVRNCPPLAKKVMNSDWPGALLLALTAQGKAEASRVIAARQPLSFSDKLASDKVQKISALAISVLSLLVSIIAMIVAFLAY